MKNNHTKIMFLVMYSGFSAVVIKSIMRLFKRGKKSYFIVREGKNEKNIKQKKLLSTFTQFKWKVIHQITLNPKSNSSTRLQYII